VKQNYLTTLLSFSISLLLASCSLISLNMGSTPLIASGTIEANTVNLGSEIGGKIIAIHIQEGDNLAAGTQVFRLDDSMLQAQLTQANAAVKAAQASQAAAQANLELLQAGPTNAQIQVAQDQLNQAEANLKSVQASVSAITIGSRPEDISAAKARLDFTRTEYYSMIVVLSVDQTGNVSQALNQATSSLSLAKERNTNLVADKLNPTSALAASTATIADDQAIVNQLTSAYQGVQNTDMPFYQQIEQVKTALYLVNLNLSRAEARQATLLADPNMTQEAKDAAQSDVDEAQTLLDMCQTAYDSISTDSPADQLYSAWTNMQTALTDLNSLAISTPGGPTLESLLNQLDAATAQRNAASANLQNIKSGARSEQITAAQAQVNAADGQVTSAQAAAVLINIQIGMMKVSSPVQGVVLDVPFSAGEIAPAGATVVEIGSLDTVTLTVFVPEDQYGVIKLGQKASVTVDSYPGKTFEGVVSYISDQAEFTPRNVQTVESRSSTVYAVKISIPNANHDLKPGMPADAEFQTSSG